MTYEALETEHELIERGVMRGTPHGETPKRPFTPRRFLLQWHITERCDLRCRHCYQQETPGESELPLADLRGILDQYGALLAKWGIAGHLNVTGGEPLLHPDFFSFLESVRKHAPGCTYGVLSNGTQIGRTEARWLARLGCQFVQISLEGGPEVHESIRGAGTFSRALRALDLLRREGVATMVSFTAHRGNAAQFAEAVDWSRRARVGVVWSDRFLPLGRGRALRHNLMAPTEVKAFFEEMYRARIALQKRWFHRTTVRMKRALQFLTLREHGGENCVPYRCTAGRSLLTLLPSGHVLPCRRLPIIVGDVRCSSLESIHQSSVLCRHLRDPERVPAGCEGCAFQRNCQGGLRCLAYAYHGDPFRADPQCFLRYQDLPPCHQPLPSEPCLKGDRYG